MGIYNPNFNLASGAFTGILPVANGGTGQATYKSILLLGASGAAVTRSSANAAGDATRQDLVTINVPAMGANDALSITWTISNVGVSAKSFITRFGGTSFFTSAQTTNLLHHYHYIIQNRNSVSSQVGSSSTGVGNGGWGSSTNSVVTGTVDTSLTSNTVTLGVNWSGAVSGESITLENYQVELLRA